MRTSNFDIFAAVDGLRQQFGGADFMGRMGQGGDTRSSILAALADGPKNGFEIIQAIHGKPADVYPTLQLLADEGLVTAEQDGERKVYSLTDAGKVANTAEDKTSSNPRMALPKSGAKLASAVGQVVQNGSAEQQEKAVVVLDDARRKLYALLAED